MPRVGLLSDSHGRAVIVQQAVKVLLEHGAEMLIHLGDVGSVEVVDAMVTSKPGNNDQTPAFIVFGNTDWDADALGRYAASLGIHVMHPVGTLELAGKKLIFTHGDNADLMTQALAVKPDYLCHGHSHQPLDSKHGPTRVINPGALFRAKQYTVATLDTDSDELTLLRVSDHAL